jgi:hypothetical protein
MSFRLEHRTVAAVLLDEALDSLAELTVQADLFTAGGHDE